MCSLIWGANVFSVWSSLIQQRKLSPGTSAPFSRGLPSPRRAHGITQREPTGAVHRKYFLEQLQE